MAENAFFGTNLGAMYCSVYIFRVQQDQTYLKENTKTNFLSVVSFSETKDIEFLFCHEVEKHPECTLYESKRLLGMRYDDPRIKELVRNNHFDSFTIVSDSDGRVKVEFVKGGKTLSMYPWKVSSTLLRHLHGLAYKRFDDDAATKTKAVIGVPVNLTHFQRAETMRAGAMAGFDVMRVINEPTAAAIAELSEASSPNQRVKSLTLGRDARRDGHGHND